MRRVLITGGASGIGAACVRRFQADHPDWRYAYGLEEMLGEIIEAASESSSIRPRGIFDRIIFKKSGAWLIAIVVFATAGVTAFTAIS